MNQIKVVGLGAGDIEQLPLGIYRLLKSGENVYLRTKEHPAVVQLEQEGFVYQSFDEVYEKHDGFEEVYEEIADELFKKSIGQSIIYGVPGHPLVAERTVQLLLERAEEKGIDVKVVGGQSFIDALFTSVKVDPIEGFQLLDGTALKRDDIKMSQHLMIGQVYDAFVASEVKLTLMEKFPAEHPAAIVTAAGSQSEKVRWVQLYELDRDMSLDNLTTVYIPPAAAFEETYAEFSTFRQIIAELRGPDGCPWDKEQTHESLKKYLIEECYELLEAIDQQDIDHIIEELGDVLLQVLLHAQIGEDEGMFAIEDVLKGVSEKMVRRHPHVFGDISAENSEEVLANWNRIKAEEKSGEEANASILDSIPKGQPAILTAYEYQKKAAKEGFDWEEKAGAWEKLREELQEFEYEAENGDKTSQLKELGDLLFSIVNVARFYQIHPEEALISTNLKFYQRFSYIEQQVRKSGRKFSDYTLEELDQWWNEAKEKGL
ncbi:nucleoside triphosphate pyrophosphohydrolase [Falsibacillus pallidus]|uniref:Tetrapyrrole methylase family protein/MazG family protein n=1 Tax=Falsibacillus pallidus TaxID=493781 RepID=A0A370G5T0_9BACI|nr:nucleoside triphosphate pyrophosphohydrolase [Falsibacillus pallidus]RDI38416.1 tetrapyrrole methylase family protein/MazG family protein [Falsibacillus pallidus]